MTIFDIKPYSFWRNLHRASVYGWVHRGHDTPRTVLKLCLLEYLIEHQQRIINSLFELSQQDGPEKPRTDVRRGNPPADRATPQTAAILPATNDTEATEPALVEPKATKRIYSGDWLPFDEFDKLARREVKRLSMDGRIPSTKLWDSERDPRLPTYTAVMYRYGSRNMAEFAAVMGMEPPLSKAMTINHNGANAIYSKEASHATAA